MIFLPSCGGDSQGGPTAPGEAEGAKMALDVRSSAFEEGGAIPAHYTCEGLDISPPAHMEFGPQRHPKFGTDRRRSGRSQRGVRALGDLQLTSGHATTTRGHIGPANATEQSAAGHERSR